MSCSFTDGPAGGRALMLRRAPLFLRVTCEPTTQTWDALDLLADKPAPTERIYVYGRVSEPFVGMVDWSEGGRRRGGAFTFATYAWWPYTPADLVLRDAERWREWCRLMVSGPASSQPWPRADQYPEKFPRRDGGERPRSLPFKRPARRRAANGGT